MKIFFSSAKGKLLRPHLGEAASFTFHGKRDPAVLHNLYARVSRDETGSCARINRHRGGTVHVDCVVTRTHVEGHRNRAADVDRVIAAIVGVVNADELTGIDELCAEKDLILVVNGEAVVAGRANHF